MGEAMEVDMTKADLRLLRNCIIAVTQYGIARYLPAPKWQKRAQALVVSGHLEAHSDGISCFGDPTPWISYSVTPKGIQCYAAARK